MVASRLTWCAAIQISTDSGMHESAEFAPCLCWVLAMLLSSGFPYMAPERAFPSWRPRRWRSQRGHKARLPFNVVLVPHFCPCTGRPSPILLHCALSGLFTERKSEFQSDQVMSTGAMRAPCYQLPSAMKARETLTIKGVGANLMMAGPHNFLDTRGRCSVAKISSAATGGLSDTSVYGCPKNALCRLQMELGKGSNTGGFRDGNPRRLCGIHRRGLGR
jgi:hypothetical protein